MDMEAAVVVVAAAAGTSATSATGLDTLHVNARKTRYRTAATVAMVLDTLLVTATRAPMSPHATTAARLATSRGTALSSVMEDMVVPACPATTVTRVDIWPETARRVATRLAILAGRLVTSAETVTRSHAR